MVSMSMISLEEKATFSCRSISQAGEAVLAKLTVLNAMTTSASLLRHQRKALLNASVKLLNCLVAYASSIQASLTSQES